MQEHGGSWAPNPNIRMISEGSCDTEDWSNDADNSASHHRNKLQDNAQWADHDHKTNINMVIRTSIWSRLILYHPEGVYLMFII